MVLNRTDSQTRTFRSNGERIYFSSTSDRGTNIGGLVFLKGAYHEIRSKIGMMTLVALAITVAFVYSVAVSLGLEGNSFYWELATLFRIPQK